ncbi:MAG: OB-fold domain-containing protein [Proteobacteria bacterium]|nr:OB-fold domain-containing protein [Pseudomonadota bacterium]MBU1452719.1 OB-fold domain-containing protein [Pseudomonadota bacterium]MBU2467859.1 OB-fold domain-containing protein [Pseudomonadota bacterium]MBU2519406.1 OB-fold domain-containing protein [Pseudomonadota bacterium]
MGDNSHQQIPLREGFWTSGAPDSGPRLIGSRCTQCGEVYFPKKPKGWCVHCQQQTLEEILLSPRGRISAVTVVRQPPAGGFYHGPVPYAYGLVDLPDGLRLVSQITADNLEAVPVGAEAELVIRPLYQNSEGREVLTFMFTPVA